MSIPAAFKPLIRPTVRGRGVERDDSEAADAVLRLEAQVPAGEA